MNEIVDNKKKIHKSFQESKIGKPNIYSVWCQEKADKTTSLSANSNNNHMECDSSSLNDPHYENEGFQENGVSRLEKIFFQNANCFGQQNHDDEYGTSPISSKFNDFIGKGEDREIYVRDVSSRVTKNHQFNSTVEGGLYVDTTMVPFECCPNKGKLQPTLLHLGKLRRVGTLAGDAWTKEEPETPCRLVVSDIQSIEERISKTMSPVPKGEEQDEPREGCNDPKSPLMIVEMIANKSDRKRVANSLYCKLEGGDISSCICYMEQVKKYYGFDHIIIIGELHAGILFLDCYGRVFMWDSLRYVLWMLGDYWDEATTTNETKWGLEIDGTVTMNGLLNKPNEPTFNNPATKMIDVHPVAKKKKNSKKKNSKKKH